MVLIQQTSSTVEINKNKTVAFSGYRTSKIERTFKNSGIFHKIVIEIHKVIYNLYRQEECTTFIVGASDGFDLIVAEFILLAKEFFPDIMLVVAVPFIDQEKNYSQYDQEVYHWVLKNADYVHLVSKEYHDRAFLDRNDYMLNNSSHLICYYNGVRGGTMYTVNRAKKQNVNIINIYN